MRPRLRFAAARQAATALLAAAAIAIVLAAWAYFTGGFRVHLFGMPISVRGAHRAAVVALVLAGLGLYLHVPLQQRLARLVASLPVPPLLPVVPIAAAAAVLVVSLAIGTRAAGGADVYGYVSQAELWRKGELRIHQPIAGTVPWPDADWTFAPLGYKPAPGHMIVPTYSPGLPMLMAVFTLVFGAAGAYFVVPICGAVLVWLTGAFATRIADRVVAAAAAVCVATSPVVLFMTLWSMSDVPVAVFWIASLLFACRGTGGGAALAGAAAGMAILVRPNLVPLAVIPLVIAMAIAERRARSGPIAQLLLFSLACAPGVLFVAWLFQELYGSPLRSGYGDAASIYAWSNVTPNLARYPRWLWESQGAPIFLFVLAPLVAMRMRDRLLRVVLIVFILTVFLAYLVYMPFEDWWYVRFLIPALPLMFILAMEVVWRGTARFGARTRAALTAAAVLYTVGFGLNESFDRGVFAIGRGEQKYAEVGRHVADALPANAVVYSMQHSGNVRYYANRLTLRLDYLDPAWLDRSVIHLRNAGYEPYFVLDNWEVPMFRARFRSQARAAALAAEPAAGPCTHTTFIYRILDPPAVDSGVRVPQIRGCR